MKQWQKELHEWQHRVRPIVTKPNDVQHGSRWPSTWKSCHCDNCYTPHSYAVGVHSMVKSEKYYTALTICYRAIPHLQPTTVQQHFLQWDNDWILEKADVVSTPSSETPTYIPRSAWPQCHKGVRNDQVKTIPSTANSSCSSTTM